MLSAFLSRRRFMSQSHSWKRNNQVWWQNDSFLLKAKKKNGRQKPTCFQRQRQCFFWAAEETVCTHLKSSLMLFLVSLCSPHTCLFLCLCLCLCLCRRIFESVNLSPVELSFEGAPPLLYFLATNWIIWIMRLPGIEDIEGKNWGFKEIWRGEVQLESLIGGLIGEWWLAEWNFGLGGRSNHPFAIKIIRIHSR